MNKYIIVSEGPTDYEVLRAVIEVECGGANNCSIEHLYPCATAQEDGGWANYRQWCRRQSMSSGEVLSGRRRAAEILGTLNNQALSNTAHNSNRSLDKIAAALSIRSGYDQVKLIFQLDTDVAEEYHKDAGLLGLSYPLNSHDRKAIGINAIKQWIGHHSQKIGNGIILCISTHSLETYLLALHRRSQINTLTGIGSLPKDYDCIPAPERFLIALRYGSKNKKGKRVLNKNPQHYKNYAQRLAENINVAKSRSSGLLEFCNALQA